VNQIENDSNSTAQSEHTKINITSEVNSMKEHLKEETLVQQEEEKEKHP
jgi:hypothetical protein